MKVNRKLKFVFLITERGIENKIVTLLKSKSIENYFLFYGKGSASIEILDYLGIGEKEKSVIIYPSSERDSNLIMENIKNSEYIKNTLVFKVPVKGISSLDILNEFIREGNENEQV